MSVEKDLSILKKDIENLRTKLKEYKYEEFNKKEVMQLSKRLDELIINYLRMSSEDCIMIDENQLGEKSDEQKL